MTKPFSHTIKPLIYNQNIRSITITKGLLTSENYKIIMLWNASSKLQSQIKNKPFLMPGLPIRTRKWGSIKMLKVTTRKLISLVTTKTTRNWLGRWMRRLILAKREVFSLKSLVDHNNSSIYIYNKLLTVGIYLS